MSTGTERQAGGPVRAVLDAAGAGIPSIQGIVAATGLPRDLVEATVDHLVRAGRLVVPDLPGRCVSTACGSCPLAPDGVPTCGTPAPR